MPAPVHPVQVSWVSQNGCRVLNVPSSLRRGRVQNCLGFSSANWVIGLKQKPHRGSWDTLVEILITVVSRMVKDIPMQNSCWLVVWLQFSEMIFSIKEDHKERSGSVRLDTFTKKDTILNTPDDLWKFSLSLLDRFSTVLFVCLFVCLLVGWLVRWLVETRAAGGPPAVLAPAGSVAHYTGGPATGGDRTGWSDTKGRGGHFVR